jgi:hypothetical protein
MTGTFCAFAADTMLAAATPSNGSTTSTFTPAASIDSACCCCVEASELAFAYESVQFGHAAFNAAVKYGLSFVS